MEIKQYLFIFHSSRKEGFLFRVWACQDQEYERTDCRMLAGLRVIRCSTFTSLLLRICLSALPPFPHPLRQPWNSRFAVMSPKCFILASAQSTSIISGRTSYTAITTVSQSAREILLQPSYLSLVRAIQICFIALCHIANPAEQNVRTWTICIWAHIGLSDTVLLQSRASGYLLSSWISNLEDSRKGGGLIRPQYKHMYRYGDPPRDWEWMAYKNEYTLILLYNASHITWETVSIR